MIRGSWSTNRSGDGDPLLLTARQLAGVVIHPVFETHDAQGGLRALPALCARELGEKQRQLDVFDGREHRHEIVGLKVEADVARARNDARSPSLSLDMSSPATRTLPDVARSSPAMMLRSVLSPRPRRAHQRLKRPLRESRRSRPSRTVSFSLPRVNDFLETLDLSTTSVHFSVVPSVRCLLDGASVRQCTGRVSHDSRPHLRAFE